MFIDFSQPMTTYELIAILFSTIALLIPIIKWIYYRWLVKVEMAFYPSGDISLFFNASGSYLRLGGTFESKNISSTIKAIDVKIIKENPKTTYNYRWSSFISPVNQFIGDSPVRTNEVARAFYIYANGLVPAFVEFENKDRDLNKKMEMLKNNITNEVQRFYVQDWTNCQNELEDAKNEYQKTECYNKCRKELIRKLFWEAGSYELILEVYYNKNKFTKSYFFEITEQEANDIEKNIDSILLFDLYKNFSQQPQYFNTIYKEFTEK